jgi:nucleoside-diphosphate-sugar epimerase
MKFVQLYVRLRQAEVKSMLAQAGISNFDDLKFVQADLTHMGNWLATATGATYVIHVASPTPATRPDADDAMVKMTVDGVLNIFRAAKAAGLKRIVLTSASGSSA